MFSRAWTFSFHDIISSYFWNSENKTSKLFSILIGDDLKYSLYLVRRATSKGIYLFVSLFNLMC